VLWQHGSKLWNRVVESRMHIDPSYQASGMDPLNEAMNSLNRALKDATEGATVAVKQKGLADADLGADRLRRLMYSIGQLHDDLQDKIADMER
jgi:hypothetical protein